MGGRRRKLITVLALAGALALLPVSGAGAAPANDEYAPPVIKPGGNANGSEKPPTARPETLPPEVREQLTDSPEDQALLKAATATELGAPEQASTAGGAGQAAGVGGGAGGVDDLTGEDPSALTATTDALGDSTVLLIAAALALILGAFWLVRRRRAGAA